VKNDDEDDFKSLSTIIADPVSGTPNEPAAPPSDDPFAFPPSLKREPPADLNAELERLNAKAKNVARSS
jgi:hypothetical protein